MPPNPKRNPTRGAPRQFDDAEILRADDPRLQRVPQYPASTAARRALKKVEEHIPTAVFDTEQHDQELRATYPEGDSLKPAFLYVERGPGAGQLVELKPGPLVIGRASVSDLRLQHPSISRRHAQFKRIGEQFFVKDLGSQNGTFVNKDKIETEIEVFPGDLIAMGNALLKLRGPLTKAEGLAPAPKQAPAKHKPMRTAVVMTRAPKEGSSSLVKVAIFSAAVSFGLGGVVAFALVRGVGTSGAPASRVRAAAEKPSAAAAGADLGITVDEVKVKQNRQIDEAISKRMQEKQATASAEKKAAIEKEEAQAPATEPAPSEDRRARPVAVARAASPSKKAAAEPDDEAPAPSKAPGGSKKTAILASYEKGNAEGSLEAAKKGGDHDLAARLQDFLNVYEAAESAMTANNGGAAIKNFEKALKLDEQLSSGWGIYGGRIRKQLASLYTLVGLQHVKNDNLDNAKIAFQAALKNDPENERAKAQLAKLGGGDEKKGSKAAAASDDEGDEKPAPKKKAAAKKAPADGKSRSQAIDDAFGD